MPDLPRAVAVDGTPTGDPDLQAAARMSCAADFSAIVGGTPADRARARLTFTYFLADQGDYDAGARWVRCDLVALERPNRLAPLPTDVAGLLDDPATLDDFGVCSTRAPDSAATTLVMCSQPHTYRALSALRLGADTASFPGTTVVRRDGRKRCGTLVANRLGLGGGYRYGWTYPTAADWKAGQRFGFCWLESRD